MTLFVIPEPDSHPSQTHTPSELRQWLTETVIIDNTSRIDFHELHQRYITWCHSHQRRPMKSQRLGHFIQAARYRSNGHTYLLGARLS
jgi:hypothetical protein